MGGRLGQSPFDALSGETFEYPIALIRSAQTMAVAMRPKNYCSSSRSIDKLVLLVKHCRPIP